MRKILVIEDEKSIRDTICEILRFEEYLPLEASDGADGVEVIRKENPDLVLCDIMLPEMDGYEVLSRVRADETLQLMPFIFLTALTDPVNLRKGMELGADDYLTKPFTRNQLLKSISARFQKLVAVEKKDEYAEDLELVNKDLIDFAHVVSHDLKAPLRAMERLSAMLLEDFSEQIGEEVKSYLTIIYDNAQKMSRLIDGLLLFSRQRRSEINCKQVNMKTLVRYVIEELRSTGEQLPVVDFSVDDLPDAWCDESMVRQVVINLISNAMKFSGKRENPRVEVGYKNDGPELAYFIKDNGAGFNMKYYHKLFGVFQRLHQERDFAGTGVGLAIVKEIVEKHGGKVWAESAVGEGATFYFTLTRPPDSRSDTD